MNISPRTPSRAPRWTRPGLRRRGLLLLTLLLFAHAGGVAAASVRLMIKADPSEGSDGIWRMNVHAGKATPATGTFQIEDPKGELAGKGLRLTGPAWLDIQVDSANLVPGRRGTLVLAVLPNSPKMPLLDSDYAPIELRVDGESVAVASESISYEITFEPPGVRLPEEVDTVAPGLEGGMLFLGHSDSDRIFAIDVAAKRLAKTIAFESGGVFAAGKKVLVAAAEGGQSLTRWNLPDLDSPVTKQVGVVVQHLLIGCAQERVGLAVIRDGTRLAWARLDLATLALTPMPGGGPWPEGSPVRMVGRISANGISASLWPVPTRSNEIANPHIPGIHGLVEGGTGGAFKVWEPRDGQVITYVPNATGTHFLGDSGIVLGPNRARAEITSVEMQVPYVDAPDALYTVKSEQSGSAMSLMRADAWNRSAPLRVAEVRLPSPLFNTWFDGTRPWFRYWPTHRLATLAILSPKADAVHFLELSPGAPVAGPAGKEAGPAGARRVKATVALRYRLPLDTPDGARLEFDLNPNAKPLEAVLDFSFTEKAGRDDLRVQVQLPEWLQSDLPLEPTSLNDIHTIRFRPRRPALAPFHGTTNLSSEIRFLLPGQEKPVAVVPIHATLYHSTPSVALPSAVQDACLGMGGQLLLVADSVSNAVHAVDLVTGAITGRARPGGTFLFAAGKEWLITYQARNATLSRWSLPDLKLTLEKKVEGGLEAIFLGASQTVSALAYGGLNHSSGWLRLDLGTLVVEKETRPITGVPVTSSFGSAVHRTSALGHATAYWDRRGAFRADLLRVDSRMITFSAPALEDIGPIFPSFRGEMFFTGHGVLAESRDFAPKANRPSPPRHDPHEWLIPSEDSDRALRLRLPPETPATRPALAAMSLVSADGRVEYSPLPPLVDFELRPKRLRSQDLDMGKRFWFLDQRRLFAVIPDGRPRVLIARTAAPEGSRAQLAREPLQIFGSPTEGFTPGEPFRHALRMAGGTPPIACRLLAGPAGMTVSPAGVLDWDTTRHPWNGTAEVRVEARDSKGAVAARTFTLVNRAVDPSLAGFGFAATHPVGRDAKPVWCALGDRSGSLLVDGGEILRLNAAGQTDGPRVPLERKCLALVSRPNHVLALDEEGVDYLNLKSLKPFRRVPLAGYECRILEGHPGGPVAYIGAVRREAHSGPPAWLELDETRGLAVELRGLLGARLRVHPDGTRLLASYHHEEMVGLSHHPFLGFLAEVARTDLLLTYDPSPANVKCLGAHTLSANTSRGFELSPDGGSFACLGGPEISDPPSLPAHDTRQPSQVRVKYPLPSRWVGALAHHPDIDLVVLGGHTSLVACVSSTGTKASVWPGPQPPGLEAQGLGYTADGRSLLVLFQSPVANGTFWGVMPLKLTGLPRRPAAPRPVAATRHQAGVTVDGVLTAISGGRLVDPTTGLRRFGPVTGLAEVEALRNPVSTRKLTPRQLAAATRGSVVLIRCGGATSTGFFIGSSGYILSCAHGAREETATIRHPKRGGTDNQQEQRQARVVVRDDRRDLCLLKLTDTGSWPAPLILSRGRPVEMGEPVVVIGNPGAGDGSVLDFTMSEGIVSSPRRVIDAIPMIQTSAAVNPGNSGGPLFDEFGNVIGVISSKADLENVGFAISSEVVLQFLKDCARPPAPAAK